MRIDSLRGRGAYACGCGARVTVTVPPAPPATRHRGCVAEKDGELCTADVTVTWPFRLCDKHYASTGYEQYLSWRFLKPPELATRFAAEWAKKVREHIEHIDELTGTYRSPGNGTLKKTDRPIVYFIQSGVYVKIGATVNLVQRLQSITVPEEPVVLLTLDGYKTREKAFHQQFAHLRCNREWFHLKDELLEFINSERAIHSLPPVAAAA
jgi:hypothetical protein